ncbi:hypothetical protein [Mesorhizobium amorphae]|uniref:hypothetical protein n=1 Tax=Mesorhizobium amorphae TaxID=71433 RepID=UPI001112C488|nr:hypothetical protein [Mesorhizobium amorphae]
MANIRSPSCECTTAFVSIFDGRKFVKGALGTRITKVGQTNIDELLVDFFCRHVKFLVLVTAAEAPHGLPGKARRSPFPGCIRDAKTAWRQIGKKSQQGGNHPGPHAFWYGQQFIRAILERLAKRTPPAR